MSTISDAPNMPKYPSDNPFGEQSLLLVQLPQEDPIRALFIRGGISEAIYKSNCKSGKTVIVYVKIDGKNVRCQFLTIDDANQILSVKIPESGCFFTKVSGKWEKSGLPFSPGAVYGDGICPQGEPDEKDKENFASVLKRHLKYQRMSSNEKTFAEVDQTVGEILANPFYSDVKLRVGVFVMANESHEQKRRFLDSPIKSGIANGMGLPSMGKQLSNFDTNKSEADIDIKFYIDPRGNVSIINEVNPNYLKQYEDKWQKEAVKRGLDVNIQELRNIVKGDIEALADEQQEVNFYKKFIRETRALLSNKIASYVEAMASTQKIAKNVWAEGAVNESTWHSTKEFSQEHKQWPEYCQFHPVVGGVEDGVIDEIIGIPQAIKGVYEIVSDDEKRKSIIKTMTTKEGMKSLYAGMEKEVLETYNDSEKGGHFAGKTTVSVVSMMMGTGFLTKSGKIADVVDQASDAAKVMANPKTLQAIDEIKQINKYAPDETLQIKKFLDETDTEVLDDIADDLPKMWKKGEDSKILAKARNLPGVSKGAGKEIKGNWLKGTNGNAGLFPKSVADKLRGKKFANFDEFRQQFWKAVSQDEKLIKQFDEANIQLMKDGYAPFTHGSQSIGGNKRYTLHHIRPINQGGGVYDMDNLYIVTPKFHKEILDPAYHYGYGY